MREHAALGYAATVHAAEGISVDASHGVVDRDATREALYVQASRGGHHNYLYLVTEREPDAHEPQRVSEVAAERLAAVLEVSGAERSATAVQAADERERSSAPVLLARLDHATRAGALTHLEAVRERLGVELDPQQWTTERLVGALRAVELAGHDPTVVLERALEDVSRDRAAWWTDSEPARLDAAAAADELDRRSLPAERVVDDEPPAPEPVDQVDQSDRESAPEAAAPEPRVFQREREAREQAVQARAQELAAARAEREAAAERDRATKKTPAAPSYDQEMLIDDELRGRYKDLAPDRGREHTLSRDLDEGPELGR